MANTYLNNVGVTDGDKGDIVVSTLGTVWTIDPNALSSPDGSLTIIGSGPGVAGSGSLVVGETPVGLVNNSNATYTTAFAFVPESVELFINGIRQKRILDFTTSSTTTVLITDSPLTGDILQLNYERP